MVEVNWSEGWNLERNKMKRQIGSWKRELLPIHSSMHRPYSSGVGPEKWGNTSASTLSTNRLVK